MSVEVLTQGGGANLQSKSVSLTSTSATTFSPQSGYDGMSSITVTPNLQSKSVTLSSSSTTVSPDSGYSGLSSVTARTNNQSTQYVTPASYPQNITPSSGYSGLSGVYVYGDSNLISENIKSGISIFGVNGSLSSGGVNFYEGTTTPQSSLILQFSVPSEASQIVGLITEGFISQGNHGDMFFYGAYQTSNMGRIAVRVQLDKTYSDYGNAVFSQLDLNLQSGYLTLTIPSGYGVQWGSREWVLGFFYT